MTAYEAQFSGGGEILTATGDSRHYAKTRDDCARALFGAHPALHEVRLRRCSAWPVSYPHAWGHYRRLSADGQEIERRRELEAPSWWAGEEGGE